MVFANTLFQAVCYGPGECQIISCGTDRKVTYYEVLDGTPVRSLEASLSGSINAMDITEDGKVFVTGGADKLIKVNNKFLQIYLLLFFKLMSFEIFK